MNNRRTFGARYAAGGGAGMNRGGGRAPQAAPLGRMAPSNPIGGSALQSILGGVGAVTGVMGQGGAQNKMVPAGGKQQGGGGRMPQRIENLQNRLENRREKIQNLKGQLNAARQQAPLQQNVVPPGQAGGSVAAPPPTTTIGQGVEPQMGTAGQSMYGQGGPMSQQMGRAAFDNPNSPYSIAKNAMNQGEQGGYGQDAGYGDNMYNQFRGVAGGILGAMTGGGMGGYDEYSSNAQQMDYGQQGGYGQIMGYGQQMNQQNVQQQSEDYIPRRSWSSQQEDQQYKSTFGTLPGEKNYVQKMENYYKQQGFPFPEGLRKHFEKEQAYALGAMGQTPPKQSGQMTKDIKPGTSKRPPARTKDIRPGTKKQLPARTKDIRPGTKKQAPIRGKAAGGSSKAGGKQGGKRFAAGGVVPRPAAARPGMKGGGLARKGVGMALKGGGLARKGVGMALKSGGMVRGAGCAQRGRGKAK